MDPDDERRKILSLHRLIGSTGLGPHLILGGSSGLSAASDTRILCRFETDRLQDAVADAQAAILAVSGDALRADQQSKGYVQMRSAAGKGLEILRRLIGESLPQ